MGTRLASQASPVDKKINWPKHAAFTVLVVLGLVFWIPPLLRATVGETDEVAVVPGDASHDVPANSENDFASTKRPVLAAAALAAADSPRTPAESVVLASPILGKTRRGAVINGRLLREGDQIVLAGDSFRLATVAADRIELVRDRNDARADRRLIIRLTPQHNSSK